MVALFNQAKYAHWNVKGIEFIALRELFDEIVGRAEAHSDLWSGRVVALDGTAEGTTRQAAGLSPYIRRAIQASAEAGDPITADLFTQVTRAIEEDLSLLEAHLQGA
jgi:starvation-inducible DNA-binding protein